MTIPKIRTVTKAQEDAEAWLKRYEAKQKSDLKHPAVEAIRRFIQTGLHGDTHERARAHVDLQIRLRLMFLRRLGKDEGAASWRGLTHEKAIAMLAKKIGMSESKIKRRIKRSKDGDKKTSSSPSDGLIKYLLTGADPLLRSKKLPQKEPD